MSSPTPFESVSESGPRGWQAVYYPIGVILLGLGLFILLPTFLLPNIGVNLDMRGRTLVGLGGTLTAELTLFAFLLRWLNVQGRRLKDIGWRQPTTALAVALGILFAFGYAGYAFTNPEIRANATELSVFKLAGVMVGVVAAIVEELVFRGYLISELARIRISPLGQILVSGISFGIIHVGFDLVGVVLTFIFGSVMAAIYVMGRRSLTPSIASHAVVNALIEPWLLLFIVTMYSRLGHAISR